MNRVTDALKRLTTARALILGLFFAALYYYFIYDNGDTITHNLAQAQSEINADQKKEKELTEKLDRAHEYQRSAAEMGEALNRLLSYIPEDFRPQDFMKVVSEEAKVAGLNIIRIDEVNMAAQRDKKVEFEELGVSVELEGSFAQQMTFLANLTKRKQIFILDRFSLIRQRNGANEADFPVLAFHANIKAYRYVGSKPKS